MDDTQIKFDLFEGQLIDPFNGFFDDPSSKNVPKNSLLDATQAPGIFRQIHQHRSSNSYNFQQPISNKTKPNVQLDGRSFMMLSSYDYLGLIGHPVIEEAAIEAIKKYGTGTGGVRILTGTKALHVEMEEALAQFKETESAITFSSGYMANIAAICTIMQGRGCILIDEKAHKSLLEACKLSGSPYFKFKHNDPNALEDLLKKKPSKKILIVIEGTYSMDGDHGVLPEIVALKRKYDAFLLVDEAHSFGCLGPTGRGLHEYYGIQANEIDIWTGSLSKTIPSNGGFVAGSKSLIYYLQHSAAPYLFSAALCPAASASIFSALAIIQEEAERLKQLHQNAHFIREHLKALGYNTGLSQSGIIPVIFPSEKALHQINQHLSQHGILASSVLYPAVPKDQVRLRLCATSAMDQSFLDQTIEVFKAFKELT